MRHIHKKNSFLLHYCVRNGHKSPKLKQTKLFKSFSCRQFETCSCVTSKLSNLLIILQKAYVVSRSYSRNEKLLKSSFALVESKSAFNS